MVTSILIAGRRGHAKEWDDPSCAIVWMRTTFGLTGTTDYRIVPSAGGLLALPAGFRDASTAPIEHSKFAHFRIRA